MPKLLPFDELNRLKKKLGATERPSEDEIIDEMIDIFLASYLNGYSDVNESLSTDLSPDLANVEEAIYREIAGETFIDRVSKHLAEGRPEDIDRVAETESHRIYNEAVFNAAQRGGAKFKTWKTMKDDRVRDSHEWLEGTTVGINEYFYSYTGDRGMHPGDFNDPAENVNCRCYLSVK